MRYGSSYFADKAAADRYYADYHETPEDVQRKLDEGAIHLGKPANLKDGDWCYLDPKEGRYVVCTADEMMTREMYMNAPKDEAWAAHRRFYGQIVKAAGVKVSVEMMVRSRKALSDGDEHLNSISLAEWYNAATLYRGAISRALKAHGDFYSEAGGVCVMKEAARRQIEAEESDKA